jgi:hypothetical protein
MSERTDKFLLVIIVLALALSPLRGAYALAALLCADEVSHCGGMQYTMHSKIHRDGIKDRAVDGAGHCCGQGCDRDCCDGACVHPPLALSGATPRDSVATGHGLYIMIAQCCSGRTVSPPFRPPISLPG